MRIAVVYPARDPLAPENWSGSPHGLARGLRDLGHEVVPVGSKLAPVLHYSVAVLSRITGKRGAVADRTPVRYFSRTRAIERRVNAARSDGLDAIVAMGLELFDLSALASSEIPIATFDDGTLEQQWKNANSDIRQAGFPQHEVSRWFALQRRSALAATVNCVSTEYAARSFVDDFGIPANRVRVVGMGHRPRRSEQGAGRDWSTPRFLFVGVDWSRKNGMAVLESFRRIRQHHPGATLDLVGEHAFVDEPGVRDHGYLAREDVRSQTLLDLLFSASTAFVLPSKFDPSPIAYLEAASAGIPVIATSRGGAAEMLGDAAIIVDPENIEAVTQAMHMLCDPAVAQAKGALAARVASTASWEHVAHRVVRALGSTTRSSMTERTVGS